MDKVLREHADDRVWFVVEEDLFTYDVWIAGEVLLPEPVADQRD